MSKSNAPGPGTIAWIAAFMVAACAAALSFAALADLARVSGVADILAPLLPITIDAGVLVSVNFWLTPNTSARVTSFARTIAILLIAVSCAGNIAGHAVEAQAPFWLTALVSLVAPLTLGGLAHLIVIARQPPERTEAADEAEAARDLDKLSQQVEHQTGLKVHSDRSKSTKLYKLYTEDRELLYVGITNYITTRLAKHRRDQPWWDKVDEIELSTYVHRAEALSAERTLIRDEKPRYNKLPGSITDNACPKPLDPALTQGPTEVTTIKPRPRPVAAAHAATTEIRTTVPPTVHEVDTDKLSQLRTWKQQNPGHSLSQRKVIQICRTSNDTARDLLTALEAE